MDVPDRKVDLQAGPAALRRSCLPKRWNPLHTVQLPSAQPAAPRGDSAEAPRPAAEHSSGSPPGLCCPHSADIHGLYYGNGKGSEEWQELVKGPDAGYLHATKMAYLQ